MSYKLTDKVPAESGYYWAQKTENSNPVIVKLYHYDKNEDHVYCIGDKNLSHTNTFILWSERIEEPVSDNKTD